MWNMIPALKAHSSFTECLDIFRSTHNSKKKTSVTWDDYGFTKEMGLSPSCLYVSLVLSVTLNFMLMFIALSIFITVILKFEKHVYEQMVTYNLLNYGIPDWTFFKSTVYGNNFY